MGPAEEENVLGAISSKEHHMEETADRPLSSSGMAMSKLESEILKLDEDINILFRVLKPIRDNSKDKISEAPSPEQPSAPLSQMAQTITEKADRIKLIRTRINSLTRSIDL